MQDTILKLMGYEQVKESNAYSPISNTEKITKTETEKLIKWWKTNNGIKEMVSKMDPMYEEEVHSGVTFILAEIVVRSGRYDEFDVILNLDEDIYNEEILNNFISNILKFVKFYL
jgi:hypothetical protein